MACAAVLLTASPALARQGQHEARHKIEGVITAVAADSVTVGATEVPLTSATRYSSPRHLVGSAADLRVGDTVRVDQRDGSARRVQLRLIALEGVATAVSADALTLDVDEANRPGTTFLDGATSATVALTDATRLADDVEPIVGDAVEVQARVSAADPTALEAIAVEVKAAEDDAG